jgi:hypothetical protein
LRARPATAIPIGPLVALLAAGGALGACSTVNLGTPPADVNTCHPSEQIFVERVFEEFLAVDFGGRSCGMGGCHQAGTARIPLVPPMDPKPTLFPLLPGSQWETAYVAATRYMNCESPTASELYVKPSAAAGHGGGMLFSPTDANGQAIAALLIDWVMP